MTSTPDRQAFARLAAAIGQLLPVDGERSLTAVAEKFDLDVAPAVDAEYYAGRLIAEASRTDTLGDVVRAVIESGVVYRRDAREPVDAAEYAELSTATEAFGITLAPFAEIDGSAQQGDASERRTRLLRAMFALYSDMMSGPADERRLKLANVMGGLLRANDIEILRLPHARTNDVHGVVRMGGIEHLMVGLWEVGDDPLAIDSTEQSIHVHDRRTLIVAVQGFPRDLRLDPDRDRRKVLFDGRDLTLLLEGRWNLPHAVRWKAREQRETGAFARLPMSPPQNDPTALALSSDTPTDIVEVDAEQKTVAANVSEFDETISEELEASEAEAKRLRTIGIALASLVVAVIIGLFINAKVQESIQAGHLDTASSMALRAAQAQEDAFERLETTGLARYFEDSIIAAIQQQINQLRGAGVRITARVDREVLRENSAVQDEQAFITFRESGVTEIRNISDGQIRSSNQAYRAILGFLMTRAESGDWLVVGQREFDSG